MATKQLRFTDYDGFTEKFKPKKTTDDVIDAVYDLTDAFLRFREAVDEINKRQG